MAKKSAATLKRPKQSSDGLFDKESAKSRASEPVECLGKKFNTDAERREYFNEKLRENLKDPEFRKIEGFPIGEDEDIIAMSDPPYYTACPNPFLGEFVRFYGKQYDPKVTYSRKPFAVDVSEGKTDPLYKAHSYHTKVPHLAIVPSILHYTEPGDLVLDGFCGTGMTGVAAQWCGCAPAEYRHKIESEWKTAGRSAPKWGPRRAVLNDLSPIATFIAANYNLPFDVEEFAKAGQKLLDNVEKETGWMYETLHTDGKTKGKIEYTVWSEVFVCPECQGEVVFTDEALDMATKRVREKFDCPHCVVELSKRNLQKVFETRHDPHLRKNCRFPKLRPSLIRYEAAGKVYEKKPDKKDLALISRIEALPLPPEIPITRMMFAPDAEDCWGDKWRSGTASFSHIHHVFLPRAAQALGLLWRIAKREREPRMRSALVFAVEQAIWGLSLMNRYGPTHFSQVNRHLSGVYYLASQHSECSPEYILGGKIKRLSSAFGHERDTGWSVITSGTAAHIRCAPETIDYIFTDPPFGDNLAYSELNFLIESFHRVHTRPAQEAIISPIQRKGLAEYSNLMESCFREYCRLLKPGRWMTVVFHNTRNSVWNVIQVALQDAGFVVADVRTLNKQQKGFNAVVTAAAMDKDLLISAYKPTAALESKLNSGGTIETAREFVRSHLGQLPIVSVLEGKIEPLPERGARSLYDRMVAFHLVRGASVPLSMPEFMAELDRNFVMRDDMYFLQQQVADYEKQRLRFDSVDQLELFVRDESTALEWIRRELKHHPQSLKDLTPKFLKEISSWEKFEQRLELRDLLADNFIKYDGKGNVPSQIHSYISTNWPELRKLAKDNPQLQGKAKDRWYVPDPNKEADLEKFRTAKLLKEFWTYLPGGYTASATMEDSPQLELLPKNRAKAGGIKKKLKMVRLEAVRTGFKYCWQQKDYETIVVVGDLLPGELLEEDEKLYRFYNMAQTKLGDED